MDANNLEFPDNHFDVVFESQALHHVENPEQIIAEMKRVSKKYIIFIEQNIRNPLVFLFCLLKKEERNSLSLSLRKLIARQNLKVTASFSHGAILPNKIPTFLLPLLKIFDKKIPWLGLDTIIICEKN